LGKNRIILLLDESGSMWDKKSDVVGGVQGFLKAQSLAPDMLVTLAKFHSPQGLQVIYRDRPIRECTFTDYDFLPDGGTPLLDAIGDIVNQAKISKTGKTLLAIFTDGFENESHRFNKTQIKALLEKQDPARFQVLYLGVALDDFSDAINLGLFSTNYRAYQTFTGASNSILRSGSTNAWFATADAGSLDINDSEESTTLPNPN
jgi:hypothetical protein